MIVNNNAYNPYQAISSAASSAANVTNKITSQNTAPARTALDSVSLSAPAMEQYMKAQSLSQQALQAGDSGLNPVYKNLDIDKDYGGWAAFKAKELFSAKPEIKDMLTVYIPPTLQEKMDADPFFAADIKQRAESFLAEKTADSYTQGKTISLTLSFDNNGEIGDRWTSTIWPELSASAVESYPKQAAAEAQATAQAKTIAAEPIASSADIAIPTPIATTEAI